MRGYTMATNRNTITAAATNSTNSNDAMEKFEKALADVREAGNKTHAAATVIIMACMNDILCSKSLKRCNMLADAASNCATLQNVCKELCNRTAITEFRADGTTEYAYTNKEIALVRYGKKGFTWNGSLEEPDSRRSELSKLGKRVFAEFNGLRFKAEKAAVVNLQPELAKAIKAALKTASVFRTENGKLSENDAAIVRQIIGIAEQLKLETPENLR